MRIVFRKKASVPSGLNRNEELSNFGILTAAREIGLEELVRSRRLPVLVGQLLEKNSLLRLSADIRKS